MTADAVRPAVAADRGAGLDVPAPALVAAVLPSVPAAVPLVADAAGAGSTVALDVLPVPGSSTTRGLDAPADVLPLVVAAARVLPSVAAALHGLARSGSDAGVALAALPVWLPGDGDGAADGLVWLPAADDGADGGAAVWLPDDDAADGAGAAPSGSAVPLVCGYPGTADHPDVRGVVALPLLPSGSGVLPLGADRLDTVTPHGWPASTDHPALRLVAWPRRGGKSAAVAAAAEDAAGTPSKAPVAAIGAGHAR